MTATARSRAPVDAPWTRTTPRATNPVGDADPCSVVRGRTTLPPLPLDGGVTLPAPSLQWTRLGDMNAARDNVVLVTHALTGTPDVHSWWAPLVGPGRALDTDRVAVLCANVLGGCAGSTGPRHEDARPFPALTTRDQARALWSLLDTLDIASPALIVGGSLGGMVALELAALEPARCREVLVLAAPAAQTALGAGWHAIMRTALDVGGAEHGLALARMAGMLSYRAPAGLESRFGPRAAQASHDTPAIAAWLARHGARLVQRFDAASYRALIDAMDRHDVARGRGTLADALGPVADRLTGVGIPGDLLYPDDVVLSWTQTVGARYASIRSLHGHDAFLLETDQVATLVQQALARSTTPPSASHATRRRASLAGGDRSGDAVAMHRRVALAGCGTVGDAVAARLATLSGAPVQLTRVLVRDVHRARAGLAAATRAGRVVPHALTADASAALADHPDTLIEVLGGLEPARTLVERALRRGLHVITANKALIAAHGPALLDLAATHHAQLDFEAAVGAGIPIVRTLRAWTPATPPVRIEAILNGTTNVVLDAVGAGRSFAEAVRDAQHAGYAEADPSRDLDGRDAEDKLRILAWLAFDVPPADVRIERRGVDEAVARWARLVARCGDAVRLLATVERAGAHVIGRIRPTRVSGRSAWAAVRGVGNRFVVTDTSGAVLELRGDGAGGEATARGVLADLHARAVGSASVSRA